MAKRVMILDALNAFIRAYVIDPSISTNGQPIGGIKGFFKILQKLVREIKPDEILIVWDGPNGSQKRKSMDKNYKAGRKPLRLNRAYNNLTDKETAKNKVWQQVRIMEYFNNMPIMQTYIPEIEADDVIAYVCKIPYYKGWQKVIVSNDKDFMQLCDSETVLLRPVKNEVLNKKRIVDSIGIHPANMTLARAIVGDSSDNLPGIRGVGLKTVAKQFPFLSEEKFHKIPDVLDICKETDSKLKIFQRILEGRPAIEHNYKMMQLDSPLISYQNKSFIKNMIQNFEGGFNQTEIIKMMKEDGFGELNWSDLKGGLKHVENMNGKSKT
jgi:5'-3' exonuclease